MAAAWCAIAALAAACLDRNPDFDGPREAMGSSAAHGSATAGSTADGTAAATTTSLDPTSDGGASDEVGEPSTCEPDGFEPNDAQHVQIAVGEYQVVLETVAAVDRYLLPLSADGPFHMRVVAEVPTLRTCGFIRCQDVAEAAQVTCNVGLSGADEEGSVGCCGGPEIDLDFTCGDGGAKGLIRIGGATTDCTYYGLTVAR